MDNPKFGNEPPVETDRNAQPGKAGAGKRMSRRAVLASLGVTGAAVVSGGLMRTIHAGAGGEPCNPCAAIGSMPSLKTTEKSTLVGAINENHDRLNASDQLVEGIRKKTMRMVSLDDFNALGNGSDDTAAIQAAIDYLASLGAGVKKALKIPRAYYRFTSLFIPKAANSLLIFSDGLKEARLICTDESAAPAIRTEAPNVQFKNVDLEGSQNYDFRVVPKIGILAKRAIGEQADIDIEFNDCRISRFYHGIEIWGRGLKVSGTLMSNCNFGVNLEWPNLSDYVEGDETAQKDLTGYRGFQFTNCRFHSVGMGAIRNAGANAAKINGIVASGCLMDIGRTFWTGVMKEAIISGITITQTPTVGFDLHGGSRDYQISDVIVAGDIQTVPPRNTDNFIKLRGNHSNGVFRDMVLKNCKKHGIDIRDGVVTNMVFENISFIDPCSEAGNYSPFAFVGPGHRALVRNITFSSSIVLGGIVRTPDAAADIQVEGVFTFGNMTPVLVGSGNRSARRIHVAGANDRIEAIGSGSPEGVVTADIGSTYRRIDGLAGSVFYVKESGNGTNTGWVAK
ncbi:hypothetical protein FE783_28635 [Paenibacillus mesophilus]|uniref:hypothetical protein n=1 Tax=Paenibacillus mesophilus TaxID=2582849 RepID=UPI00110DDDD4|nr:hypothetical protein [Paenibacillus mesophilus]TMV45652.1 hypothetical protein FE783_28635 [Paenibacillus mesophilus]